jgi:hypothetical protein
MSEPSRAGNCLLAGNAVLLTDRFILEDNDFIGSGGLSP